MILLSLFITLLSLSFFPNPQIELTITNVKTAKGTIYYCVYTPANKFLDNRDVAGWGKINVTTTRDIITKIDVPADAEDIAIAIYQDMNSNAVMDKSFLGIPREPYGFSRNYVPTVRAPKWSESNFNPKVTKRLTIQLIQ